MFVRHNVHIQPKEQWNNAFYEVFNCYEGIQISYNSYIAFIKLSEESTYSLPVFNYPYSVREVLLNWKV
jgi:hypothetical protein